MDLQLTGKRAFVSGGNAGIGLEIAKTLASEGAHVVITSRSAERLEAACAAIQAQAADGVEVQGFAIDITTPAGVAELTKKNPDVDILVNNLGIYEPKEFTDIADEDWQRLFDINVMNGVRLSRHYLPGMLERDHGRIVFVSSESAITVPSEMIHYAMTKAAQLVISRGMAELTKGTGVTVNAVMPGPTRSAGISEFLREMASTPTATDEEAEAEFFRLHRSNSLLQRLIDPSEIGRMVAYLASPLTVATNGAALRAEGGLVRSIV